MLDCVSRTAGCFILHLQFQRLYSFFDSVNHIHLLLQVWQILYSLAIYLGSQLLSQFIYIWELFMLDFKLEIINYIPEGLWIPEVFSRGDTCSWN